MDRLGLTFTFSIGGTDCRLMAVGPADIFVRGFTSEVQSRLC
jgi:hypothetical protein